MELWFCLISFLCLYASFISLLNLLHKKKLPPGPLTIPFFGNIFWLLKSSKNFSNIEPVLHQLRSKYGPIVTLHIGSRPAIFITTHETAHRVLVKHASLFASRPSAIEATRIFLSNQSTVSSAPYGSLWRFLRANFLSITHPSRLKSYSNGRKWALDLFKKNLKEEAESEKAVCLLDHFQHALFALLCYMCFGEKYDEKTIGEIETAERGATVNFIRFNVLNFMPRLGKIVFRNLWKELVQIRQNQVNVVLPLIKARRKKLSKNVRNDEVDKDDKLNGILFYIDTILNLKHPNYERKFTDEEMVSLVTEFLLGGTDTTATTFQWIMANLMKHQDIQEKLVNEINEIVKPGEEIEEEELKKMHYLKAVVLETLRRHPPSHFILPRAVTEDTVLEGYHIPKNAMVNFTVAEMAWDPNVWEDPMEFKPERFLRNGEDVVFDLKGVREIKMMPFGAGRRVCPAIDLSLLHLEFFVANLVRDFKWMPEDGCEVDMTEQQVFTIVMKNPLRANMSQRIN